MIQCKNRCPLGKFNGCCWSCPDQEGCSDSCEERPATCDDVVVDEETGLMLFQQSQLETLNAVSALVSHKKAVEDQEKKLKAALYEAMMKYGVKKFESDVLNLTLVLPSTSTTIDTAKVKKKYPDVAADCSKTSTKAGYVKITLKGGNQND